MATLPLWTPCSKPFHGSLLRSGQDRYLSQACKLDPATLPACFVQAYPTCLVVPRSLDSQKGHLCGFSGAACPTEPSFLPASSIGQVLDVLPKVDWIDLFSLKSPLTCSLRPPHLPPCTLGTEYSALHGRPSALSSPPPPSFQFLIDSHWAPHRVSVTLGCWEFEVPWLLNKIH